MKTWEEEEEAFNFGRREEERIKKRQIKIGASSYRTLGSIVILILRTRKKKKKERKTFDEAKRTREKSYMITIVNSRCLYS